MVPKTKIWLEFEGESLLGRGGAKLLENIEKEGSLTKAIKNLNISYRYAWGYLKKIEKKLGGPIVETFKGGKDGGGGMRLTPLGKYLMRKYNRFENFIRLALENSELWEACGFSIPDKNRLSGQIVNVEIGDLAAFIQIELKKPFTLTSIITTKSVEDLKIDNGDLINIFIKSTEIMVDKPENI
ncbi:MAG: TOBE domain-containing protein [Candidatus Jordarchaeum sp.]|uniref:TOBE domain-containing protein n=1 Tax=Candidatus Jordarchaeum sp. TaxID=2823881 RepID=UPI00404A0023